MDVDPLADTVPPRYAIESDEEEDEINPLHPNRNPEPVTVNVQIVGETPTNRPLVVATGDSAAYWAKGARLGEQTGAIGVNGVQIGLVFNPPWTKSTIIISEVLSRLPVYAMHPYAEKIINTLQPSNTALLDSYPVPTYASNDPPSLQDAPIRYLSTTSTNTEPLPNGAAHPFSPPNLIQSASASFLAILSIKQLPGTLILLPSPHIPHPAPRTIAQANFLRLSQDDIEWSTDTIRSAQDLLFQFATGELAGLPKWDHTPSNSNTTSSRKRFEVGEGGMYI